MEFPVKVIIWQNGMVMAFDSKGEQMPDWKGKHEDLKEKLKTLPKTTIIEHGNWRR
jgi:hypothetical protein